MANSDRAPRVDDADTLLDHPIQVEEDNAYLKNLLIELTRSEARLEEDRAKTEAMINSLGEGLIMTDEDGRITTVNPYACHCLGMSRRELIGAWFPKAIIAVDHKSQRIPQLNRPILRALTSGRTIAENAFYLKKTGESFPVFITVSPVVLNGRPVGAIETFRDLTKERQLEIAKEEFVSLASHQLRTPATGVKLILSMLAAGDFGQVTALQQRYLQKAIQSNDRQLNIIEDLLNVARVDSGKMDLNFEFADIVPLVEDVVAEHAALVESRNQKLVIATPPKAEIFMDVQKIRMVIDNLISNAIKYSANEGDINISLKQVGGRVVLAVSDHGIGMSEDDISKLFTKFTRLQNELSASVSGTGLGLFLVKNIVELHQGRVWATSKQGVGSTFTVQLPVNQGA